MTTPQEAIEGALQDARQARNQGNLAEATRLYAKAADMSRVGQLPGTLAHALRHVSDIARERGELQLALAAGEEAVGLYQAAAGSPLDLANALRVNALAVQALHGSEAAQPLWAQARLLYVDQRVQAGVDECERQLH